jgi:hypothetical protein
VILSKSLKHGWYYYYKVHEETLDTVRQSGYSSLADFLLDARQQENRPDSRFERGPRSSQADLSVNAGVNEVDHLVTDLASIGLESDYYKDNHMNVQMFMLAYDKQTFAMEVPVWFQNDGWNVPNVHEMTGHIDLLRIEDNHVWVWDYKPDAHLEETATTQTLLYAMMLSDCADIPLDNITCGYFDELRAYTYDPAPLAKKLRER